MASSSAERAAAPLAGLMRLGRALAPVMRWLATRAALGTRGLARLAVSRRRELWAVGLRLMWWGALAMLVLGGPAVLGHDELPPRWRMLAPFAIGLALCGVLRLLAPARHLRVAALGLGALHGLAVVLVWTAYDG